MPKFICPLSGKPKVVSGYPKRNNGVTDHLGVDYAVPVGTPVRASAAGEVIRADCKDIHGYGNQVRVWYPGFNVTGLYGHLSEMIYKVGQKVKQGDIIAKTGGDPNDDIPGDGKTEGAHLHETIFIGKAAIGKAILENTMDPRAIVKKFVNT